MQTSSWFRLDCFSPCAVIGWLVSTDTETSYSLIWDQFVFDRSNSLKTTWFTGRPETWITWSWDHTMWSCLPRHPPAESLRSLLILPPSPPSSAAPGHQPLHHLPPSLYLKQKTVCHLSCCRFTVSVFISTFFRWVRSLRSLLHPVFLLLLFFIFILQILSILSDHLHPLDVTLCWWPAASHLVFSSVHNMTSYYWCEKEEKLTVCPPQAALQVWTLVQNQSWTQCLWRQSSCLDSSDADAHRSGDSFIVKETPETCSNVFSTSLQNLGNNNWDFDELLTYQ